MDDEANAEQFVVASLYDDEDDDDLGGGGGGGEEEEAKVDAEAVAEVLDLEEDVDALSFGTDFRSAEFLSNVEVAILLLEAQEDSDRTAHVAEKTLQYVQRFGGGGDMTRSRAAADELRKNLINLEFPDEDDPRKSHALHSYQFVALCNLNPPDVETAKALIPMLDRDFTDTQIQEFLDILARSTARVMGS